MPPFAPAADPAWLDRFPLRQSGFEGAVLRQCPCCLPSCGAACTRAMLRLALPSLPWRCRHRRSPKWRARAQPTHRATELYAASAGRRLRRTLERTCTRTPTSMCAAAESLGTGPLDCDHACVCRAWTMASHTTRVRVRQRRRSLSARHLPSSARLVALVPESSMRRCSYAAGSSQGHRRMGRAAGERAGDALLESARECAAGAREGAPPSCVRSLVHAPPL